MESRYELPEEILEGIFDYLPEGEALTRVALVCRRFHRIVQSFFFKTVRLSLDVQNPAIYLSQAKDRWARFYQLVNARPEFRGAVRNLHVKYHRRPGYSINPQKNIQLKHLLRLLPALETLWIAGSMNIAQCLYYDIPFERPELGSDIFSIEDLLCDTVPRLNRLVWEPGDYKTGHSLDSEPLGPWFRPNSCSHVTDLRLYNLSPINNKFELPQFLSPLLLAIHTLRTFHLEFSARRGCSIVLDHSFRGALATHDQTLEELLICASNKATYSYSRSSPHVEVDFSHFSKLKRFGIPEPLICRDNDHVLATGSGIPRNIEVLQLQYPMGNSFVAEEQLRDERICSMEILLTTASIFFPNLNDVCFWLQQAEEAAGWTYAFGSALDKMEDSAAMHSRDDGGQPRFHWLSTPFVKDTPFLLN